MAGGQDKLTEFADSIGILPSESALSAAWIAKIKASIATYDVDATWGQ